MEIQLKDAPFVQEICRMCSNMYAHGWNERTAGNISLLLSEEELAPFLPEKRVLREIPSGFRVPELAGKLFLVTKTGNFFRNVELDPEQNLGIIRIAADGETAQLLWGFSDGGTFTSEFAAHMMSHAARLQAHPENRVILHCHPTNLVAMTFVHDLDEREFTRTLWRMCTECVYVFPDGISVLPWMVCATNEIGLATAEKMKSSRIVVWPMHGIYAAGADPDEAFGLIEAAEKAAEIYLKIAHFPQKQTLTDAQLHLLEERFHVKAREGWLD